MDNPRPMRMTIVQKSPECRGGYCFRDREERLVEVAVDFVDYLEESAEKLASRTIDLYARALNKLCGWLEGHETFKRNTVSEALAHLNRVTLNAFFRHLQREGLDDTSISIIEAGLRRFCM